MQVAVIHFSDHHTAAEIATALLRAELESIDFNLEKTTGLLSSVAGFVIISNEQNAQFDALITTLKQQSNQGKPILGIGSGAAFLTKIGLIPGIWDNRSAVSLSFDQENQNQAYRTIRLSNDYQYNAFTRYLTPQQILNIQPDPNTPCFCIPQGLQFEIEMQGLNVFMYCDEQGRIIKKTNIAAISNKAGNVMAMLPNPLISLGSDALFKSMRDHIISGYIEKVEPLYYWPRK